MTPVAALLTDLAGRDIHVTADGDRLRVRPARALTADDRAALVQHRATLVALLAAPQRCGACGGALTWTPDWPVPGEGRWLCLAHAPDVTAALGIFEGATLVAEDVPAEWPPEGGWVPGPDPDAVPQPSRDDPHAALRADVLQAAEGAGWPAVEVDGPSYRHLGGEAGWRAWVRDAIGEDLVLAREALA